MALIRQASRGILRAVNNLNNKPTELVFKTTEPSGVTTYKYDQVDRLTEAVGPTGSFLYQHDGNSNRTKQTINGVDSFFAVDAADQLCHKATTQVACGSAPAGSTTFSYDANGNLTGQSDGRVLTYNAKDQNTSFKGPGAQGLTSTMGYFGAGQAERTDAAGTSFTNGPLGVARTSALLSSTAYVRDPSGTLVSMRGGLTAYYYLFDRLGSVVALTDGAGDVVNRYVYDPYGNPLAGTVEAVVNPWQFAGGLRDAFSGYYKFGERYYDPEIGRWTQRDPSGQDANSYAYAGANPVNFVDLTGLAFWSAVKGAARHAWNWAKEPTWYEWAAWAMGGVAYFGCWATVTGGSFGTLGGAAVVGCSFAGSAVKQVALGLGREHFDTRKDLMETATDMGKGLACDAIVGPGRPLVCPALDAPIFK